MIYLEYMIISMLVDIHSKNKTWSETFRRKLKNAFFTFRRKLENAFFEFSYEDVTVKGAPSSTDCNT